MRIELNPRGAMAATRRSSRAFVVIFIQRAHATEKEIGAVPFGSVIKRIPSWARAAGGGGETREGLG
jgi:hypothetical protein